MLLSHDEEYLKNKGYEYEAHESGSVTHVIIRDYSLPAGFSPQTTDLLVDIPSGYPDTGLDMFWVLPHVILEKTGSPPAAADYHQTKYGSELWQRFSRHGYPWKQGDSLASYLIWVRHNLENDVT